MALDRKVKDRKRGGHGRIEAGEWGGEGSNRMQKKSAEYQPPEGAEAEAEPGSRGRVLRNKFGTDITSGLSGVPGRLVSGRDKDE